MCEHFFLVYSVNINYLFIQFNDGFVKGEIINFKILENPHKKVNFRWQPFLPGVVDLIHIFGYSSQGAV